MARATLTAIRALNAAGQAAGRAGPAERRVRDRALAILRENVLCATATVSEGGQPHINTSYFCYSDDLNLYFLSHPDSQHCDNIRRNSSVAVAVYPSTQRWGGLDRGLQLFGSCSEARGAQKGTAAQLYSRRFPGFARWSGNLGDRSVAREYCFYRVLVTRLKVLDEQEFGEARFIVARVRR